MMLEDKLECTAGLQLHMPLIGVDVVGSVVHWISSHKHGQYTCTRVSAASVCPAVPRLVWMNAAKAKVSGWLFRVVRLLFASTPAN